MKLKKLLKNKTLHNLTGKLGLVTLGKLLTFVTVPIISKALGAENYGIYTYIITIASYSFLLANWGFLAKGIREIANPKFENYEVIQSITSSRFVLWLIGGCSVGLGFYLFSSDAQLIGYIVLAILANLGMSITIDYHFYGIKDALTPSLVHFGGQLLFLILIVFFVENKSDIVILLGISILYKLLEALVLFYIYQKKNDHTLKFKFSLTQTFEVFKNNFYLGLGSKASFFQSSFPILIIPYFLTQSDLGVYSAAYKLFLTTSLLIQSMNLVFSPWIVESKANQKKSRLLFIRLSMVYLLLGMLISVFFLVFGDLLIDWLFGDEFESSKIIIQYFAYFLIPIWPIFMLLSSFMNNYVKDQSFFKINIIQVLVIIILTPLLLKYFGLLGVVLSSTVSTLLLICLYFMSLKKDLWA